MSEINPQDYILKEGLNFSWQNRFHGNEYTFYQGYIKQVDENKLIRSQYDYYKKEWGIEMLHSTLDNNEVMKVAYSHEFITNFSKTYIDLPIERLVKKKPNHLKKIDYTKFVGGLA